MRRAFRAALIGAVSVFAALCYTWITLPDVRALAKENPTSTAFMRLRQSEDRPDGTPYRQVHRWVPYERISPVLKRAVLVTEDAAFWDHDGVDYAELQKSMQQNWSSLAFARGGSTITQQLAKNLYLSPSRNPYRKLTELMISRRMEHALSKRRILELYLNLIEWGDGVWGAEAAARTHFGVSSSDLTPEQTALLAGAIINPRVHSPSRPDRRLLARQRLIMARMGTMTPPANLPRPEPLPTVAPGSLPPGLTFPGRIIK